jgi:hypothetical protein
MKKYVIGILLVLVLGLATGCGTKEVDVTCEDLGGNYLEEHNECEYLTQEECDILGGTFDDCASACRHDPNAEMCIEVCVPVCYL